MIKSLKDLTVHFLPLFGLVLLTVVVVVFINTAPELTTNQHLPPIQLNAGSYSWRVYVVGDLETWNLAYPDYDALPVKNSDYNRVIEFKGRQYRVWRIWSGQMQVSKPIN